MAESASNTAIPPIETSIEDANGALWTLRLSDRAVLKDGVSTRINNVQLIWYLDHVVYAFKGTHWRQWSTTKWVPLVAQIDTGLTTAFPGLSGAVSSYDYGPVKPDFFPSLPPLGFLTTAGLRRTPGVRTLASHAGVSLPTGTNPQTIIDANPAGTTYVFATGTHTSRSIVPKTGDIFVGLTGAILNGNANTDYAFSGNAAYVTLYNITITNYTANVQHGMVERLGPYLLMQDCTLTANTRGGAINLKDYATIVACKLNDNNEQGYSVHGDSFNNFVPIVGVCFYSNQITGNNPTGQQWGGSEQGGGKSLDTEYLSFFFNWSGNNQGSNFWSDYNNIWTLYWGNQIGGALITDVNTGWNGVEHEISQNCKVLYNNIWGIGAGSGGLAGFLSTAGVFTGNSGGVEGGWYEIAHNDIVCPQYGRAITARMQDRSVQDQYGIPGEPRWLYNTYIHHNTIDITAATGVTNGHVGMQADNGSDIIFYGPGKPLWNMNTYEMGNIFTPFVWGSTGLGQAQWQTVGQDLDSTFNVDPEPAGLSEVFKNSHATLSGTPKLVTTNGGTSYSSAGRSTDDYVIQAGDKKYWEVAITFENGQNFVGVGVCNAAETFLNDQWLGSQSNGVGFYCFSTEVYSNGVVIANLASYVVGQTVCIAYHGGVGYWFRVNGGNWNNNALANPATGVGGLSAVSFGDVYPAYNVSHSGILTFNFGNSAFSQAVPAGFSDFVP